MVEEPITQNTCIEHYLGWHQTKGDFLSKMNYNRISTMRANSKLFSNYVTIIHKSKLEVIDNLPAAFKANNKLETPEKEELFKNAVIEDMKKHVQREKTILLKDADNESLISINDVNFEKTSDFFLGIKNDIPYTTWVAMRNFYQIESAVNNYQVQDQGRFFKEIYNKSVSMSNTERLQRCQEFKKSRFQFINNNNEEPE